MRDGAYHACDQKDEKEEEIEVRYLKKKKKTSREADVLENVGSKVL